jgi:hypothetical protein
MGKNMPKIAELMLSSSQVAVLKLRTSVKIAIAELRNWGCGATFLFKVAELQLQKCFLPVAELRLRTQKIVARAHLCTIHNTSCSAIPCLLPLAIPVNFPLFPFTYLEPLLWHDATISFLVPGCS